MTRKTIAILSIMFLITSIFLGTGQTTAVAAASWPKGPSVFAESAIVMEASTGLVLYEKNINTKHYPASITKIMTVLLALENSSPGDTVTTSYNAVYDVDTDSSRIWIDVDENLTMQQSLYGVMLESANDCAYAIAEHVSGSVENFSKLMTEKAKSIGCKNTNFTNPHGLQNENHYTTSYDMALITREALKNESFRKIFTTKTYQIPPTNKQTEIRYLRNHHKILMKNGYTYEGIVGGKTGYTKTSKYTLVTVAKRGDMELICVIMKDDTSPHQYTDTQALLDFGFNNFSTYPIADTEGTSSLNESPMFTRYNSLLSSNASPVETDKNAFIVLPNSASVKDANKDVTFFTESQNETPAVSSEGNRKVIGKISYTYDEKYVGGTNILYKNVKSESLIKSEAISKNPTDAIQKPPTANNSLRFIIIGCIVGLIVAGAVAYYILIERPRLKRRKAYYKKRASRHPRRKDDFLNL